MIMNGDWVGEEAIVQYVKVRITIACGTWYCVPHACTQADMPP
jgi:hypothetical protein